ncbi:MAG: M23 family metallopeptidase [Pseudomonadota bacterium]
MIRCLPAAILIAAGHASAFEMGAPVACDLGRTCFIQQYVDHDPGPGSHDLRCSPRTYDGHKGTDFRLPDLAALANGVAVLAPAGGVVRAVRDGEADRLTRAERAIPVPSKLACGNGVLIDHGQGWVTQSCHLKNGSVLVSPGDRVEAGDRIAEVGMSGRAEFPHLHLSVRKGQTVIDPFNGLEPQGTCEGARHDLWSDASGVSYDPGGALAAGILSAAPEYDTIRAESPHAATLPATAPALIMWAHFYGLEIGDEIETALTGPDGAMIANSSHTMPKSRALEFRYTGRKARGAWAPGRYTARAVLRRQGEIVDEITRQTELR